MSSRIYHWNLSAALEGDRDARLQLASFVLENLPDIDVIVKNAERQLRNRAAGETSFEAYVGKREDRVHDQVEALFSYLQEHDPQFRYRVEKPPLVDGLQEIRLAQEVLTNHSGNCIDWVLLLAACVMNVGLCPLILIVGNRQHDLHALVGYWHFEEDAGRSVAILDADTARASFRSAYTAVNATRIPKDENGHLKDFSEARVEADEFLTEGWAPLFAVNVSAARRTVQPLVFQPPPIYVPPPSTEPLIGREDDVRSLCQKIFQHHQHVCLYGLAGIGKTFLATAVVRKFAERPGLFDCIIWLAVDRQGGLSAKDVLDVIIRDAFRQPDLAILRFREREVACRDLLNRGDSLLVFDNFEVIKDPAVLEFLKRLPARCKALLLSRERVAESDLPANQMSLKGLTREDAFLLIDKVIETMAKEGEGVGPPPVSLDDKNIIYDLTAGYPLAIRWAAGAFAVGTPLKTVIEILDKSSAVDRFSPEHSWNIRLEESWQRLERREQQILMAAALFPQPLSYEALMQTSGVGIASFVEGYRRLNWTTLLTRIEPDRTDEKVRVAETRFRIDHPIVETFVGQKLDEDTRFHAEAKQRAATYYLKFCRENSPNLRDGYRRLRLEIENIFRLWDSPKTLLDFLEVCSYFLYDCGYWQQRVDWSIKGYDAALELAQTGGAHGIDRDKPSPHYRAGKCAQWVAWFHSRSKKYEKAEEWVRRADECFKVDQPLRTDPRVSQLRGMIAQGRTQYEQAETFFQQALRGFQAQFEQTEGDAKKDKEFWLSTIQTNLGDLYRLRGKSEDNADHYSKAETFYDRVLKESEKHCCDSSGEVVVYDRWAGRLARTLGNLGDVYRKQPGTESRAVLHYRRGHRIAREIDYLNTIGACAIGLGLLQWPTDEAKKLLSDAVQIFKKLGSRALGEEDDLKRAQELLEGEPS
jgi:tetratricopeptide (TPR) repeat protein